MAHQYLEFSIKFHVDPCSAYGDDVSVQKNCSNIPSTRIRTQLQYILEFIYCLRRLQHLGLSNVHSSQIFSWFNKEGISKIPGQISEVSFT